MAPTKPILPSPWLLPVSTEAIFLKKPASKMNGTEGERRNNNSYLILWIFRWINEKPRVKYSDAHL